MGYIIERGIVLTETLVAAFRINSDGTGGLVSEVSAGGADWVQVEGSEKFTKLCRKCGGTGQHWAVHQDDGVCYSCNGSGVDHRTGTKTLKELEQKLAAKAREFARKEAARLAICAERDARVARLAAAEPAIADLLQKTYDNENEAYNTGDYNVVSSTNKFLREMAAQIHNAQGRDLSERQLEAVRKFTVARPSTGAPVVEGRYEMVGKVVSTKTVESDFGTGYKMLVELADGQRVFGSIPNNLWSEVEFLGGYRKLAWDETDGVMKKLVGMELKFTATVERSSKDESFGFFKRPTKASVVA